MRLDVDTMAFDALETEVPVIAHTMNTYTIRLLIRDGEITVIAVGSATDFGSPRLQGIDGVPT